MSRVQREEHATRCLWPWTPARDDLFVSALCMQLPANMSSQEKREKMAIMEAAISSSLAHPNVVQVCTKSSPHVSVCRQACVLECSASQPVRTIGGVHFGHDLRDVPPLFQGVCLVQ